MVQQISAGWAHPLGLRVGVTSIQKPKWDSNVQLSRQENGLRPFFFRWFGFVRWPFCGGRDSKGHNGRGHPTGFSYTPGSGWLVCGAAQLSMFLVQVLHQTAASPPLLSARNCTCWQSSGRYPGHHCTQWKDWLENPLSRNQVRPGTGLHPRHQRQCAETDRGEVWAGPMGDDGHSAAPGGTCASFLSSGPLAHP